MNTDIGAGLVVRGLAVYRKRSKWSKWSRISRWIIRLDHLDHLDHFLYTATIPFIERIGLVSPPS